MNVIIEEEVLVPDVPIIEEQVLYPSNPISVEEEVLVPAIYQEVQRQYKLDPLWDSLEETPKNHIQMIVYKGKDEDYDEIPEQEALELQEKYNNNGDRNIN